MTNAGVIKEGVVTSIPAIDLDGWIDAVPRLDTGDVSEGDTNTVVVEDTAAVSGGEGILGIGEGTIDSLMRSLDVVVVVATSDAEEVSEE